MVRNLFILVRDVAFENVWNYKYIFCMIINFTFLLPQTRWICSRNLYLVTLQDVNWIVTTRSMPTGLSGQPLVRVVGARSRLAQTIRGNLMKSMVSLLKTLINFIDSNSQWNHYYYVLSGPYLSTTKYFYNILCSRGHVWKKWPASFLITVLPTITIDLLRFYVCVLI